MSTTEPNLYDELTRPITESEREQAIRLLNEMSDQIATALKEMGAGS